MENLHRIFVGRTVVVAHRIGTVKKPLIVQRRYINDLDGGPDIDPLTTKDDFTIVGLIDAFRLKSHVESEAFKNSTPKYPEKKKVLE
jgi:hypothetical protein